MTESMVSLRDAKARLSKLTERAAAGSDIVIAKHGKPSARLTAVKQARKAVDLDRLRKLTGRIPQKGEGAAHTLRKLRDPSRY